MGCGCGGRRGSSTPRQVAVGPTNQVSARQVQPNTRQAQAAQRQALVQQTKDRIQQANSNVLGAKADIEKRRRIQVSLRNRNNKPSA